MVWNIMCSKPLFMMNMKCFEYATLLFSSVLGSEEEKFCPHRITALLVCAVCCSVVRDRHHHYALLVGATGETIMPKNMRQKTEEES